MLVEVWFLNNGIRNHPPCGRTYRPHLVVNETQTYLGVLFDDFEEPQFGEHIVCNIKSMYPGVDYSKLKSGSYFEIKEGRNTVGEGFVIE